MLDVLATGYLVKPPELRTGQSGNPFCRFLMAVYPHGESESILVSGLAFNEVGLQIGRLCVRDPIAVIGTLKPAEWVDKDGVIRTGLNMMATGMLSPLMPSRSGADQTPSQSKNLMTMIFRTVITMTLTTTFLSDLSVHPDCLVSKSMSMSLCKQGLGIVN